MGWKSGATVIEIFKDIAYIFDRYRELGLQLELAKALFRSAESSLDRRVKFPATFDLETVKWKRLFAEREQDVCRDVETE